MATAPSNGAAEGASDRSSAPALADPDLQRKAPASPAAQESPRLGESQWRLRYESAVDERGGPCVVGEARVALAPGERARTLAIAFSPVFPRPAAVEVETDHEDVSAEVVRTTQTGTRIAVRRSEASHAVTCTVSFYAATPEDDGSRNASTDTAPPGVHLP